MQSSLVIYQIFLPTLYLNSSQNLKYAPLTSFHWDISPSSFANTTPSSLNRLEPSTIKYFRPCILFLKSYTAIETLSWLFQFRFVDILGTNLSRQSLNFNSNNKPPILIFGILQLLILGKDCSLTKNMLGQRKSQTPISSAFWVQKDFWVKKVLGP